MFWIYRKQRSQSYLTWYNACFHTVPARLYVSAGGPTITHRLFKRISLRYDANNDWPFRILWTDESHYNIIANGNTKNCVHKADKNLHALSSVIVFDRKVSVWFDTTGIFTFIPYLFKEATPTDFETCLVSYAAKLSSTRIASAKCTI